MAGKSEDTETNTEQLTEGLDYYLNEEGLMVFTKSYLLRRGYCCETGCSHCPYGFKGKPLTNSGE
jgi:hypothetical protein